MIEIYRILFSNPKDKRRDCTVQMVTAANSSGVLDCAL